MAYAAVTSLMETLSLHFLQSQPAFPLDDLEAQIRDGNEKLGLLQQILEKSEITNNEAVKQTDYYAKEKKLIKSEKLQQLEALKAQIRDAKNENLGVLQQILEARIRQMELNEEASSKRRPRIKTCFPRLYGKLQLAWDSILLTSRLREVAEVKQKIVSLHQNLGLLQQSLEKSEIPYDDARVMKDLEAQIRDASFELEERIEMELTAIYLANDSLHVTACLLRLHQIFNEAEKQTDYLKNELIRIRRRGLLHKKIIVSNLSKNTSKFDNSRMVGCDKLFEKILDQLLTQQTTKGRQVVSIVGMGGIGKTTLAHQVYEHPSITSHFYKRAWVTVSQEYNVEQMLQCLLSCVTATSRVGGQDQLAECLRKHLKEQRYLIVMDDIWSTTPWDSVQRCFPDDNNGSRILLTSRLKEVGEYASSGNSPLNMPFLDPDESWNLYCKVFGKTEFVLVFEQIGREIVKKCEGLPLAIIVVASLLSKIKEEEEEWKNVAKSVIGDSNDACSRILYLSYHQLPHHLKACFLYFGVFREDYEIPVKKLVRLWAAEGFLRAVKHVNMEKVAMECLQNLVDRSLVIVSELSYNGEMKKIRIHDLLRDLCLKEAGRENLLNVNVIGDEKLPIYKRESQHLFSKSCRWISDTSECLNSEIRSGDKCFDKSHSLHSRFDYSRRFYFHILDELLSYLKLLRVVDIGCGYCSNSCEVNVFASLVHLRYFSLTHQYRNDHPPLYLKLFEHRNMQSFIVCGRFVKWDSSSAFTIWTMPLLRNFCVERICSLETSSVVHRNLENISWLDSKLCTPDLFTRIPNLKKLGIEGRSANCFYNFVHLGQLEALSIRSRYSFKHIPCSDIPWATSFLPNLKKLKFFKTWLPWSDMRLIGMLPNLEVLKLIDACQGPKWEPHNGGFRRLKWLVIQSIHLKYWTVEGDHFPVLECLKLYQCTHLQEIPSGFVDITTLALIELNYCKDSLLTSAKWIQDEQLNNYGNSILVRS
ncbi:PREDICTED: putative late blight resistance protein homolog R1A-4 [Ipomoea nil]|uniref:putative late blight resistance protein homolog R1A-4 n=1 Tax=Ipomoea nil TaxID=35883 RepID=UPI000900F2DC|nr:PREDICTED: putative late blight resistance protein homolog R1A-4 [Ipomoea nil]